MFGAGLIGKGAYDYRVPACFDRRVSTIEGNTEPLGGEKTITCFILGWGELRGSVGIIRGRP